MKLMMMNTVVCLYSGIQSVSILTHSGMGWYSRKIVTRSYAGVMNNSVFERERFVNNRCIGTRKQILLRFHLTKWHLKHIGPIIEFQPHSYISILQKRSLGNLCFHRCMIPPGRGPRDSIRFLLPVGCRRICPFI